MGVAMGLGVPIVKFKPARIAAKTILGGDIKSSEICLCSTSFQELARLGVVQDLFVRRGKSERRRRVKITSERDTK
jgi:hypothetical protein